MTVRLELADDEAEWLDACLGLVVQLARKWENRTADDIANRTWAKLTLARVTVDAGGLDPDEWLARRGRVLRRQGER